jgi:heptosyltransferase-2
VKILIRAPNWVGDAIMAIPALAAIRNARPESEIVILARPAVADTYWQQPFADRTIVFDDKGLHRVISRHAKLIAELRREKFDAALLLQNAFQAAWLAWRAAIPERIGFARDGRGPLLTRAIAVPKEGEIPRHESQYYLELLRRAGWIGRHGAIAGDPATVEFKVNPVARAEAEATLIKAGATHGAWRFAIAPGASYGAAKCWPPERFAALADRLVTECGAETIFFGTPREKDIAARITSSMRTRPISLVGETSTRELPALMAACSAFIGNDSGAMHVAAAVGLPVIGIFGSTDPAGTAPLTEHFTLIQEQVSCSPCFLRKCPVDHRCMERIEVDTVFRAASKLRDAANKSCLGRSQNG